MFGPSAKKKLLRLLRRLLTAVPFASSLRDTASTEFPLFGQVVLKREYSSHRVIRYTFLLARRIYMNPSE